MFEEVKKQTLDVPIVARLFKGYAAKCDGTASVFEREGILDQVAFLWKRDETKQHLAAIAGNVSRSGLTDLANASVDERVLFCWIAQAELQFKHWRSPMIAEVSFE